MFVFIIGICIGSFLNVCIYRIPREESIAYPPSHCTSCGHRLGVKDLVPIFSYLFLKKRCRYCSDEISSRYALIELAVGIIFLLISLKYGFSLETLKYTTLMSIMFVIALIDLETMEVYFKITFFGAVCGVIFLVIEGVTKGYSLNNYLYYLLGAVFPALIITVIILLTKGMGWGDVEIIFVSGLFLGFKLSFLMIFISFIIGAVISIFLLWSKRKGRKDPIPFGPFIALGTFFAILMGDSIINLYISHYINMI
ncbi:prepilin peptidase [Clostridium malenominatum]